MKRFLVLVAVSVFFAFSLRAAVAAEPSEIQQRVRQAAEERVERRAATSSSQFVDPDVKPTPIQLKVVRPKPEIKVIWEQSPFKLWRLDKQWYFSIG